MKKHIPIEVGLYNVEVLSDKKFKAYSILFRAIFNSHV